MKRQSIIFGIISLFAIFLVSCNQQRSGSNLQENFADIREEKVEVVNEINEALAASDMSEFKRKTGNALDKLDNQIDDYQDAMDNADRKIGKQTREAIISMKQKKTAIEFKLDLLEDSDWRGRTDDLSYNRVSDRDRVGDRTTTQGQVARDARQGEMRADDNRIQDVRTDQRSDVRTDQRSDVRTDDVRTDQRRDDLRTDQRRDDLRTDQRSDVRTDQRRDDSPSYQELVSEIKRDLQELKNEIESFIQRDLN